MSSHCSRNRTHRLFWSSVLIITIIGCGILIYMSYIYRVGVKVSCAKCNNRSSIQPDRFSQGDCQKVCFSKECVQSANFLLENIDRSVDPCENFYSFSCGNYAKKFSRADDFSVIEDMHAVMQLKLKGILDELKEFPNTTPGKLKIVYDSCVGHDASEVNAVPSTLEYLNNFGIEGWPNLKDDFMFTHSSLEETVGKLAAYNEFAFVRFKVTPKEYLESDETHSTESHYNFTIENSYPLISDGDPNLLQVYESVVHQMLNYFKMDQATANRTWEDFKNIDSVILRVYVEAVTEERDRKEKLNIDEYDAIPPSLLTCSSDDNRNVAICKVLEYFVKYSKTAEKYSSSQAYISRPYYVENVFSAIANFSSKSVANYIALRFFLSHLNELNAFFRVLLVNYPELHNIDLPFRTSINKWRNCVAWMGGLMTIPLGELYISKVLSHSHMEEMISIIQTLMDVAANKTHKQLWIEESQREALKHFMETMINNIERIVQELSSGTSKVKSIMEEFQPTNQSFIHNIMEYQKCLFGGYFLYFKDLESSIVPRNLFLVNAYQGGGELDVMFGMFLPPVFQHGLPKLLNFVTLGNSVGHEIGHEFHTFFGDQTGLNNRTDGHFKKKKKCLEDQYFDFEIPKIGKRVQGNMTVSENLADLIGIELTQEVIKKFLEEDNGNNTFVLPALGFSTKQLLYVSAAQMWCSVRSEEKELQHYESDYHAPPDARVNGMFQNVKEFSEAFHCLLGSKMNPVHKCSFFEDSLEVKD